MGSRNNNLWMGDLDPYMDEGFIQAAFFAMGEAVLHVKIIKDRTVNTYRLGYCFVEFESEEAATGALHRCNGKIIPNSSPSRRFKLNVSGQKRGNVAGFNDPEYSLFIGDLSSDVDDAVLYRTFRTLYPSVRSAKVVTDSNGFSKGFGFVRFNEEDEQQRALVQMQGYRGCGSLSLRISLATKKSRSGVNASGATNGSDGMSSSASSAAAVAASAATAGDYSQYYSQYGGYYPGYDYSQYYGSYQPTAYASVATVAYPDPRVLTTVSTLVEEVPDFVTLDFDLLEEDHNVPFDIDEENNYAVEQSKDFYDSVEYSRWLSPEFYTAMLS